MKTSKSVFGLLFALLPILYCGGLVYYFVGVPGRLQSSVGLPKDATDGITTQLGPTVIGLGAFGILFAVVFMLKVIRAAGGKTTKPPAASIEIEEGEPFDADAALARYMAKRAAGELSDPTPPSSAKPAVGAPATGGFGRRRA